MGKNEATTIIRQWVRKRILERERVNIPDLATEGVHQFRGDSAIVQAIVDAELRRIIYEIASSEAAATRQVVVLGDSIVSRAEFKEQARNVGNRWLHWREHVNGGHVALMAMTREDVAQAVAERRSRAAGEAIRADFLETLGRKLTGNKTIGQTWKPEDIEALWTKVHAAHGAMEGAA